MYHQHQQAAASSQMTGPTTAATLPTPDDVCRICYQPAASSGGKSRRQHQQQQQQLLSLCRCRGSVAFTHAGCLARWLRAANATVCELCGAAYPTAATTEEKEREEEDEEEEEEESHRHQLVAASRRTKKSSYYGRRYLSRLLRRRRRTLAMDAAYTVLLFAPSATFLLLHLRLPGCRSELATALACGCLLMALTLATWLVTVVAPHRSAFLAWRRRRRILQRVLQLAGEPDDGDESSGHSGESSGEEDW